MSDYRFFKWFMGLVFTVGTILTVYYMLRGFF